MNDDKAHIDSINARWENLRVKPSGFVPSPEEWANTNRQWFWMVWLCILLMASTAVCGVLMLDYKQEAMEYRHALDNATSREVTEQKRVDDAVKALSKRLERK